jgi:hypothetical protein
MMGGDKLVHFPGDPGLLRAQATHKRSIINILYRPLFTIVFFLCLQTAFVFRYRTSSTPTIPIHASKTLQKCRHLHTKPRPSPDFDLRKQSDRFVPGTRATLIRNATIWTGGANGLEISNGDLLLDCGLIKAVGRVDGRELEAYGMDLVVMDVGGAWVTPGFAFKFNGCLTRL